MRRFEPTTRQIQLLQLGRQVLRDELHRLRIEGLAVLEAELQLTPSTPLEQRRGLFDGLAGLEQPPQRDDREAAAQEGADGGHGAAVKVLSDYLHLDPLLTTSHRAMSHRRVEVASEASRVVSVRIHAGSALLAERSELLELKDALASLSTEAEALRLQRTALHGRLEVFASQLQVAAADKAAAEAEVASLRGPAPRRSPPHVRLATRAPPSLSPGRGMCQPSRGLGQYSLGWVAATTPNLLRPTLKRRHKRAPPPTLPAPG